MQWLKTFQKPPEGYDYREMKPDDGVVIEGICIENPITGGTMEKDGVAVAYAGVNMVCGKHWVFFFIKDDSIRNHGLWLVRLIRDSVRMLRNAGISELYALCDTTKPQAEAFLTTLGFAPLSAYDKSVDILVYEKMMGAKAWRRVEKGA